ncbi:phospholipid scramblase-related protein [Cellulomonas sp. P5_C6]
MSQHAPANWYPDPHGRFEHRFWDGSRWTEHVGSAGRQAIDPPLASPPMPPVDARPGPAAAVAPAAPTATQNKKVQRQLRQLGVGDGEVGGGTLFTESVLVVNQRAKLFEMKSEFGVYNQHGQKIGAVREKGYSVSRAVMGGDNGTRRLQIVDLKGRVLLTLTRPATVWKSKFLLMGAEGRPVGEIVQENLGVMAGLFGGRYNIRFRLESAGQTLGSINAESWQAWDFSIQDTAGVEIARITKTWSGWAKERFTKADNYVVEIHRPLEEPLRSLVVGAALAVDTALKQDGEWRHKSSR